MESMKKVMGAEAGVSGQKIPLVVKSKSLVSTAQRLFLVTLALCLLTNLASAVLPSLRSSTKENKMQEANPKGYYKCEHPKVEDHGMSNAKDVTKDYKPQGMSGNADKSYSYSK